MHIYDIQAHSFFFILAVRQFNYSKPKMLLLAVGLVHLCSVEFPLLSFAPMQELRTVLWIPESPSDNRLAKVTKTCC